MQCIDFSNRVKRHFDYLSIEYGLYVAVETGPAAFGNCSLQYQSQSCRVLITLDRRAVHIDVGSLFHAEVTFALSDVVAYLRAPTQKWEWFYSSPEGSLDDDAKIEWQIADAAEKMRPYCGRIFELFQRENIEKASDDLKDFSRKRKEESWDQFIKEKRRYIK